VALLQQLGLNPTAG
jgi:glyoxylase I family protein